MVSRLKQPKEKKKLSVSEEYTKQLMHETFVVIDIETSGLSPKVGGEIIEVAAVKVNRGRIVDEKATLINPKNRIYAKTTQITGITNEDLKGKPVIEDVIPGLVRFIGDSPIVAHNATFEKLFLTDSFNKQGFAPTNDWLCTMKMFRHLYPERKKLGVGAKLSDLVEHYNVELPKEEAHRALADTLATAKAFLRLREELVDAEYLNKELLKPTTTDTAEAVEEDKVNTFVITGVRYWEKLYNKKRDKWGRRLYVNFYSPNNVRGSIYYDVLTNAFVVQKVQDKTKANIIVDMNAFEKAVLEYVGDATIQAHLTRIGVYAKMEREQNDRTIDKHVFLEDELVDAIETSHVEYVQAEIPYDTFSVTGENEEVYLVHVTHEKRGSKYKYFEKVEDIK